MEGGVLPVGRAGRGGGEGNGHQGRQQQLGLVHAEPSEKEWMVLGWTSTASPPALQIAGHPSGASAAVRVRAARASPPSMRESGPAAKTLPGSRTHSKLSDPRSRPQSDRRRSSGEGRSGGTGRYSGGGSLNVSRVEQCFRIVRPAPRAAERLTPW